MVTVLGFQSIYGEYEIAGGSVKCDVSFQNTSQIACSRRADVGYWSALSADFADVGPTPFSALTFPAISVIDAILEIVL